MLNQSVWDEGLSIQAYINQSEHFQKELKERVRDVRLTPYEKEQLNGFERPVKIAVLTESWCGDSLMNLPILAKIEEVCLNLQVRVFPRNHFSALNQFFIAQGYDKIPLFWFMDADFNKIGAWMERPAAANRPIKQWMAANPDLATIMKDITLSEDERKAKIKPLKDEFIDEAWNWYDTGLQSETIKEIFMVLGLR
ncbi:MAG: hypothetical protein CL609_02840 [Anaerolineaceae bacterium]|nr:hypothetical protein [Anaerolineaceae bacterium]